MRKIITSFFVLVFVALGIFNVYKKISYKQPSDGIIWKKKDNSLVCAQIIRKGVFSPKIQEGDILLEIDGNNITNHIDYEQAMAEKNPGEEVVYELLRGEEYQYSIGELVKKRVSMVYFYMFFLGFASLFIVYYTLFQPSSLSSYSQTLFFLLGMSFFSIYVFSPTLSFRFWDSIFYWIDKLAFLFFPALLFHFFLLFPKEYNKFKKAKYYLYMISGIFVLAYLFFYFGGTRNFSESTQLLFKNLLEVSSLIYFSVVFILTLALVFIKYKKTKDLFEKKQLKWVFWGINAGFLPFFFFYILPFISNPNPPEWANFLILFQLIIPLTFAYAISGHKLMDFEIIAKKYLVYIVGFTIVLTFYILVVQNFAPDFEGGITIGAAAILLGVLVLKPLYTFLEELTNKLFYRRSYSEREDLVDFSKIVTLEKDLSVLSSKFLDILVSAFVLRQAAIYLYEEKSGDFGLLNETGDENRKLPVRLFFSDDFMNQMKKKDFLWFHSIDEVLWLNSSDKTKIERINGYHILPLLFQGKIIGFLTMSRKIDGDFLTTEDWSLLLAIAPSLSLAIENAALYTSLKHRIEEFKTLKDFSENILENVKIGIFVIDEKKRIKHWNKFMEDIFGVSKEEAIGENLEKILGIRTTQQIINYDPKTPLFRIRITDKNNRPRNIEVDIFDLDSKQKEKIILFNDNTEKLNLEREIITKEKMASLGLLSAGIVHEINTPLTGISSYAQLLKSLVEDSETKQITEKINSQVSRIRQLIKSLLNFSREGHGASIPFNLMDSIEEIRTILEHEIKKKKIKLKVDGNDVFIKGERVKIQQAIINFVINAIDASPRKSEVKINIFTNNGYVNLEVIDNGKGIHRENIPFIFDPFFTTKGLGKGTGLGLSIAYKIIKEHNGDIKVRSKPEVGTKFTIIFPEHRTLDKEKKNSI